MFRFSGFSVDAPHASMRLRSKMLVSCAFLGGSLCAAFVVATSEDPDLTQPAY